MLARFGIRWLLDRRLASQFAAAALAITLYARASNRLSFAATMDPGTRSTLYVAVAGAAAALLGFVLTALAVLVTLPEGGRLTELKRHQRWPRVADSYFGASRALSVLLVLSLLGVALDSGREPWLAWEYPTLAAGAVALTRCAAALVALHAVLSVSRAPARPKRIEDPGP